MLDLGRNLHAKGGNLYLYDVKEGACDHFMFFEYLLEIGAENIYESKAGAIAGIFGALDRDTCRRCRARIFEECATVPPASEVSTNTVPGSLPSYAVAELIPGQRTTEKA
ncbi:hypothetical protein JWG42_11320 [Desulfoprunum benzoelyticum]|uniref:Uncharacterized protein n=1 Tax=Desulfoprunum benzoelyticum TaxID=1506996 RepID=A0A840UNW5_9BACT|nr:hypothetical protein [Desulfoprunum benzoelyticum]MBB5347325.1 hypothetical protein [Desulfoprunum benzoelyticum]MBM9530740.1 hypothetical protein [Desulfoprunum benzoelyticum]